MDTTVRPEKIIYWPLLQEEEEEEEEEETEVLNKTRMCSEHVPCIQPHFTDCQYYLSIASLPSPWF
jgi:hypothetical protein